MFQETIILNVPKRSIQLHHKLRLGIADKIIWFDFFSYRNN